MTLACAMMSVSQADAESVSLLGDSIEAWAEKSFVGNTQYRVETIAGANTLVARSKASASILYRRQEIDLTATPVLSWRWRVDNVFAGLDERVREHDDYPARLYVVAGHPLLPWTVRSLCYVWASGRPSGSAWPNPYAPEVMMIALRSGTVHTGGFVHEQRDVYKDFKRYFDVEQEQISGVAVMTDTDNTGTTATSFYADIRFSSTNQ